MTEPTPEVSFSLDGRPATGHPGEMLISAAERAGTYIPRFCYHPRMKPVGMCRMCLVEVSSPRGATLQPACFIAVGEGMEVTTDSAKVKKAQDGVLEFLLVNHPLDCPVCDKGGECPLQDQTLAYGPGETRFIEEKRHYEKPIAISELVLLDRERCIQCARCTRFAEEIAGEAQIDFAGRGERVEVATFPKDPFSSYFSGNTVQICPVGALTATPYRFTARPWDLEQVESTCTTCALGCRVAVQSSANRLTRLLGIDADPTNQGWLCDKGRFVFEAVNGDEESIAPSANGALEGSSVHGQFSGEVHESGHFAPRRLTEPMVRKSGELVPVSWTEALRAAAQGITDATRQGGPGAVAVVGGARLTNEGAYAWAKLAKGLIGTDNVDAQLADGLPGELVLSLPRATIDQATQAKVILTLSGDLREELPVLFLRIRDAVVNGSTQLIELVQAPSALSANAKVSLLYRPGDAATLARAVTGDSAAAKALGSHPEGAAATSDRVEAAASLLQEAGKGSGEGIVIVLGRPSLGEQPDGVAEAAQALAAAWPAARFLPALRRGNVFGALDMGLAPGLLPGRVSLAAGASWFEQAWGAVPAQTGRDTTGIFTSLAGEGATGSDARIRTLVLLGAEPLADYPDRTLAERALGGAEFVIAVAGHHSPSLEHADVVLPAAVAHERPGSTTNIEGRVTRLGQKLTAPGFAWPDWMIATELAEALDHDLGVRSATELFEEIERLAPAYRGLDQELLDASGDGVVVPVGDRRGPVHAVEPIDPVALPGVESVERQGAPLRVGYAEPAGGPSEESSEAEETVSAPALLDATDLHAQGAASPVPDSYSLRLVSGRQLYDAGSSVTESASLGALVPTLVAGANPYDLDRLGLATGDLVRLRTARGTLELPAKAEPRIPRGVVSVDFNVPTPSGSAGAAELIDATAPVNDVRVESV
jgi:NADH-quinone oxidoreductase subunit G